MYLEKMIIERMSWNYSRASLEQERSNPSETVIDVRSWPDKRCGVEGGEEGASALDFNASVCRSSLA